MQRVEKSFTLTMTGDEMQLSLYGIFTDKVIVFPDRSNLGNILARNVFDSEAALTPANAPLTLKAGDEEELPNMAEPSRGQSTRRRFADNGQLHRLYEWVVKGQAGDMLHVTWFAFYEDNGNQTFYPNIDIDNLSR